jgi:hypothetical protein
MEMLGAAQLQKPLGGGGIKGVCSSVKMSLLQCFLSC